MLFVPFWVLGIVAAMYVSVPLCILSILLCIYPLVKIWQWCYYHLKKNVSGSESGNKQSSDSSPFIWCTSPKIQQLPFILLAFIAGYLLTKNSVNLPENHISNLFHDSAIVHETEYISKDSSWEATLVYDHNQRKDHIQQNAIGRIISDKHSAGDIFYYTLELKSFIFEDGVSVQRSTFHIPNSRIILFTQNQNLKYGDIIQTCLHITENKITNLGQKDLSLQNRINGIYGTALNISPVIIIDNKANIFLKMIYNLRCLIRNKIENTFTYSKPLALAIILGDRNELREYGEDFYSQTLAISGVLHLFAVSGLHVGIIALMLISLLNACRIPLLYSEIITILLLTIYAFILNLSPPVIRAVIFFSFLIYANNFGRKVNKWHLLLLTLFIVTLFNPLMLFSVSLQYSFLAFTGVILYIDFRKKAVLTLINRLINYLLFITFIHLMILAPMLHYFNIINFNDLVSNAICIPIFTLLLPLFFIIIFFPLKLPFLVNTADFLTEIFNKFVEIFGSLPLFINFTTENLKLILMQCLIFISLIILVYQNLYSKIVKSFMLCAVALCLLIPSNTEAGFKIIFFDTGNADATLIRFSKDDYMIIDTSEFENNSKNISKNMINYIKKEKITHINKVLITHPHSDHYAGIFFLSKHAKIDTLFLSEYFLKTSVGHAILNDHNFDQTTIFALSDTLTYHNTDYDIKFLHPDKGYRNNNPNNMSVVCKITYHNFEVLFTGDIEKDAENYILDKYKNDLHANVLKVAHHGSSTSSQYKFIDQINPELAVICASGKKGVPSKKVLDTIMFFAQRVYTTGLDGSVAVQTRK